MHNDLFFRKTNGLRTSFPEEDWKIRPKSVSDLQPIGNGLQGVVYKGKLKGDLVAVKTAHLGEEKELITEIKHLHQLNHENIVRFKYVLLDNFITLKK